MGWWSQFDRGEVSADFERIAASGLDSVRVFLTWEDFQPSPETVDREMLGRLVAVADVAAELGLALIPTLFTGHMSGVNWIPAWALGGSAGDDRFRVVSDGAIAEGGLRNWYSDAAVADAQALLAAEAALADHEAVWAWDLGNENSNCVIPPTTSTARVWLARLTSAIVTPTRRRCSPSGCTWKTSKRTAGSGLARSPRPVTSCRCTAIRSTHPGPTVPPTSDCARSSRGSRAGSARVATCCSASSVFPPSSRRSERTESAG
jgi:hypothetical protein